MTRRRLSERRVWRAAGIVLYALGLLAVLGVSVALDGGETEPAVWALAAIPAALMAAASLVVRRSRSRVALRRVRPTRRCAAPSAWSAGAGCRC